MQPGFRRYQASTLSALTPQESEIIAFTLCNTALTEARDKGSRVRALYKAHQLWSTILRDVSMEANGLPAPLKSQLAALSLWVMGYCIVAINFDRPVDPIVHVNQDMIDGLRAQSTRARTETAQAQPQDA